MVGDLGRCISGDSKTGAKRLPKFGGWTVKLVGVSPAAVTDLNPCAYKAFDVRFFLIRKRERKAA